MLEIDIIKIWVPQTGGMRQVLENQTDVNQEWQFLGFKMTKRVNGIDLGRSVSLVEAF